MADDLARYARQVGFPGIGEAGQRRLLAARATVIGLGATGSALANHLVRAGVGRLRLVDADVVELHDLHRQALYDEEDAAARLPKAVAAARKLRRARAGVRIEEAVAEVAAHNVLDFVRGADVVLDGTDNFETRFLVNDACVELGTPWVYCGVHAAHGMTHTILPGATACLRCFMDEMAALDSAVGGVIGPIVGVMAGIAAAEAVKLIVGRGAPNDGMICVDLWDGSFERYSLGGLRPDCPACGRGRFEHLEAGAGRAARRREGWL